MVVTVNRVSPPPQLTGVTATAVHGIDKVYSEESGVLVDRTTEFTTGVGVPFMTADNDYLYIGLNPLKFTPSSYDRHWCHLHINLTTPANVSVQPTFECCSADNTWSALLVTDGTVGFTQNGTITINLATFPGYYEWVKNSRDGSGNEIGDGVDRFYIRIKRTTDTVATPPTINEAGVGILTANTTYYYKAWAMKYAGYTSAPLRSIPSDETSATTTDIKRSIKIEWDATGADTDYQYVMRTPTSENYLIEGGGAYTDTNKIDSYAQSVNGGYFYYCALDTNTNNYTVDIGVPLFISYRNASLLRSQYSTYAYFDKARGAITVSGGTVGTPAHFRNVYDADIANGWDTFIKNHLDWASYDMWTCFDNIYIEDYFSDGFITLYTSGEFNTNNCTQCIFGTLLDTDTNYGGLRLIYANSICNGPSIVFKNTTFYGCSINDDPRNNDASGRNYSPVYFYDNCGLYDMTIEGRYMVDICRFDGDNISANNLKIVNLRYGFEITDASIATATVSGLRIFNRYSISTRGWTPDTEITYSDFEIIDSDLLVWNWPGSIYGPAFPNYKTIFNFIDFTLTNSLYTSSQIAKKSEINEYFSLTLTCSDSGGTAVENAIVIIKDVNGDEITGSPFTTDVNGQISANILRCKYTTSGSTPGVSLYTYVADITTSYYPLTMEVVKAGYQTYNLEFDITEKSNWEIALQYKEYYDYNINTNITNDKLNGSVSEIEINGKISSEELMAVIEED
jgi:hypothetical protein